MAGTLARRAASVPGMDATGDGPEIAIWSDFI